MAELIRGKSGRVLGHLTSLQHTLKGLPLTYNRDLQEDKEVMFDTTDTLVDSLTCFCEMIVTLTLNKAAIQANLDTGYLTATEFADYLVRKGVPFRDAHEKTGKVVNYAVENNKRLDELSRDEFTQFCKAVDDDVYDAISIDAAIQAKNGVGGTSTAQVTHQIKRLMAE